MFKKISLSALGSLAIAVVAISGWFVVRDNHLRDGFAEVRIGMPQVEVVRILGKPKAIRDCSGVFAPSDLKQCTEAYVYASSWAPLIPDYLVVWFDEGKHVIGKYEFKSP